MSWSKIHIVRNTPTIRFRRWSRSSYASFIGLHKNVTIGTIAAMIADRLMLKGSNTITTNLGGSHLSLLQRSMSEVLSMEI